MKTVNTAPLVTVSQIAARLKRPRRTINEWCRREGLGVLVGGRRVLWPGDVRRLVAMAAGK